MNPSILTAVDRDAARAKYVAPGVLELRLRGRLSLEVLRSALRDIDTLALAYPAAHQLLVDASELRAVDRASPGAMAQWLAESGKRFDLCAFVAVAEMVRMMLAAVAARISATRTVLVASRAEGFIAFDTAQVEHALRSL